MSKPDPLDRAMADAMAQPDPAPGDVRRAMEIMSACRRVAEWLREVPDERRDAALTMLDELIRERVADGGGSSRYWLDGRSRAGRFSCGCKARGAAAESEVEFKPEPHFLDGDGPWEGGVQ